MSDRVPANSPPAGKRHFGIAWACAALTGLVFVAWLVDAVVTTNLGGRSTWAVSALAAAICWFGAMVSLVLLHLLRLRGSPVAGVLLGMLIRMTIPLAIVAMATMQRTALSEAGLAGQLIAFYLIALTIETSLSLALVKSVPRIARVEAAASQRSAAHG